MRAKIPFIGGAYKGKSLNINTQRCVNMYPEIDNANGKNAVALIARPGYDLFTYIGVNPMRGVHVLDNLIYAVSGNQLLSFDGSNPYIILGTLNTIAGNVSMANNGTEICIVDGVNGYIYNINTHTLTQITAGGFPNGADTITFLDGYFIVNKHNTGSFYISGLYAGTSWSALDFATAEADPDKLMAVFTSHRELWLFGEYTTEVWYSSGAVFPFARMQGLLIEKGLSARWSVAKLDNALFWLAQDRTGKGYIVRTQGYTPEVISTRALEYTINNYPTISDAFGISFTWEGHPFYMLTFPTANATWVYDVTTAMWHEWSSYGIGRFKGQFYCFFNGKHLFGDFVDGDIYVLSGSSYTDNGTLIQCIRTAQHIHNNNNRLFFSEFVVDIEMGSVSSGVTPKAILRYSDDGGHTWSNEKWADIGKLGEYKARAKWTRLGSGRDRVFELTMADSMKKVIVDAYAEISEGIN